MSSWTKGSRFWTVGPWIVLLATAVSLYFGDPNPFTGVATVFLGGAGAKSAIDQHHKGRSEREDLP